MARPNAVTLRWPYAYMASIEDAFVTVFDVATSSVLENVSSMIAGRRSSRSHALHILGDCLYVVMMYELAVFNISEEAAPIEAIETKTDVLSGHISPYSLEIASHGTLLFIPQRVLGASVAHLLIIDVTTPNSPINVGFFELVSDASDGAALEFNCVCVSPYGDLAYVAAGAGQRGRVFLLNVTDPAAPFVVGVTASADSHGAPSIALMRLAPDRAPYLYAGSLARKLIVINVQDPRRPVWTGWSWFNALWTPAGSAPSKCTRRRIDSSSLLGLISLCLTSPTLATRS